MADQVDQQPAVEEATLAGPPAELFQEIPSDSWLDLDRTVPLANVLIDSNLEHGQVRPLSDQKVEETLASLKNTPPVAVLGPDKFLLAPVDSVGMQSPLSIAFCTLFPS